MSTHSIKEPEVINAFLDDDGQTIRIRERLDGRIVRRRVPAEFVTWHDDDAFGDEALRQLKSTPTLRSMKRVGKFWRIGWKDEDSRRSALREFRRHQVVSYEGDVDPVLFWLIESRAKISAPKRCYLDLEGDSNVPISSKEKMRILSWAITDEEDQVHAELLVEDTDEAERELLQSLASHLSHYDQICVWEGDWRGGEFDSVVLPARWREQGIFTDPRTWLWVNQLAVWKRMNQHSAESGAEKESYALEAIAHEQIGKGKEPIPQFVIDRFGEEKLKKGLGAITRDLYDAGGEFRELLLKYNIRDAVLLRELEAKKGYLTLFQALCQVCGIIPVTNSLQPTKQMDGFMIRLGREREKRFPTRYWRGDAEEEESERKKFKGAVVFQPKTLDAEWRAQQGMKNGILQNVHVCDFSGMYPSIMITWNLGAEAIIGRANSPIEIPPGHCWSPGTNVVTSQDEPSMVTLGLRELIKLRKKWAELAASLPPGTSEYQNAFAISTAYKVAANSFYGASGSPFCRFYNREVAESTTQNGVHFLRLAANEAKKRSMEVVYGDTDSNMLIGPSIEAFGTYVKWLNEKCFPKEVARCGCKENHIKIAFEKTFDRIVFVSAKRYIGRFLHYKWSTTCNHCKTDKGDPGSVDVRTLKCRDCGHQYDRIPRFLGRPEIKGLEYKRGDKGLLTRELQAQVIDMLVGGVTKKNSEGIEVPVNPDIETPTDDIATYVRVIERMRDHVMVGKLRVEEVQWSKGLNQSLREYGKDANEAHVRVARMLAERGTRMVRGMRVEYVVVDGSISPQQVIPAEDYAGEFDRFHMWKHVYTPTMNLLACAFPSENWARFEVDRPASSRSRSKKISNEQLGFKLDVDLPIKPMSAHDDLAVPTYRSTPLMISIPEGSGKDAIDRVLGVIKQHPGARPIQIVMKLKSGFEAVMASGLRISPSPNFKAAIEEAIQPSKEKAS